MVDKIFLYLFLLINLFMFWQFTSLNSIESNDKLSKKVVFYKNAMNQTQKHKMISKNIKTFLKFFLYFVINLKVSNGINQIKYISFVQWTNISNSNILTHQHPAPKQFAQPQDCGPHGLTIIIGGGAQQLHFRLHMMME